jgi:acyl-CoA thioester hydrolase
VQVDVARIGRTSFTLDFEVASSAGVAATAATAYVVVRTDGSGKCEIPPVLVAALQPPR